METFTIHTSNLILLSWILSKIHNPFSAKAVSNHSRAFTSKCLCYEFSQNVFIIVDLWRPSNILQSNECWNLGNFLLSHCLLEIYCKSVTWKNVSVHHGNLNCVSMLHSMHIHDVVSANRVLLNILFTQIICCVISVHLGNCERRSTTAGALSMCESRKQTRKWRSNRYWAD